MLSDARLALHPFAAYAARAGTPSSVRTLGLRLVRILLVLGAFVSVTTAGRFVPFHIVSSALAWSFAPLAQAIAIVLTARLFAPRVARVRLLDLYFAGHVPWLLLMWTTSVVCILPLPGETLARLILAALPIAIAAAAVWGVVITAALFRGALAMSWARAAAATLVFYVAYAAQILAWFAASDQLVGVLPSKAGL